MVSEYKNLERGGTRECRDIYPTAREPTDRCRDWQWPVGITGKVGDWRRIIALTHHHVWL